MHLREYTAKDEKQVHALLEGVADDLGSTYPPIEWLERFNTWGEWLEGIEYRFRLVAFHRELLIGHIGIAATVGPDVEGALPSSIRAMNPGELVRLFVGLSSRRSGVGSALLAEGAAKARQLGHLPVLSTYTEDKLAQEFYEKEGWTGVSTGIGSDTRRRITVYCQADDLLLDARKG